MWKVTPIVAVAPAGPDVEGISVAIINSKEKGKLRRIENILKKNSSIRKCPEVKKCVGLSCRIMPTRS